jgi:hypothetical protein
MTFGIASQTASKGASYVLVLPAPFP